MLLQKGSKGANVTYLQYGLKIMCCYSGTIDDDFGSGTENAVKKYQRSKGISDDGIVGDGTWGKLKEDITKVQRALNNKGYSLIIDGIAGATTYDTVVKFQKAEGLEADGMVGTQTWQHLNTTTPRSEGTPVLKKGSKGTYVTYLQQALRIMCCYSSTIDDDFGSGTENAVKKYQGLKSIEATGVVDDNTWNKLKADITKVQEALNNRGYGLTVDGIAGSATYSAVLNFQSSHGLGADGMVGAQTWDALGNPDKYPNTSHQVPATGGVSNALVDFVKSYEGFSSTPYYDTSGVKTIGYGSTHGWIMNYSSVTRAQAFQALMEEINECASSITSNLNKRGVKLSQQEFDALASFAYNCGIGALLSQSTLYKRVCSGVRDESLRKNFTDWCHSGGEVSQGLVNRRNEECDMFLYGDYNRDR